MAGESLVLLDGAMGTELQRRGAAVDLPLWSARALVESPDLVREIHVEYARSGCDVLTTNTFRTHRRSLAKAGLEGESERLTKLAARLAREASKSCRVAGSVSPLEDCYRPDLSPGAADDEFLEIAATLTDCGVDHILIETMNNIIEMRSAIRACQRCGIGFWVSVNPTDANPREMLSGERVEEALRVTEGEGGLAFLVNCAAMATIESALKELAEKSSIPLGGYANNGVSDPKVGWRFDQSLEEAEFAAHAERLASFGASIIGGCCGTNPEHLKAASEVLRRG